MRVRDTYELTDHVERLRHERMTKERNERAALDRPRKKRRRGTRSDNNNPGLSAAMIDALQVLFHEAHTA